MNLTVNSIRPQVTPHFGATVVFAKDAEGQEAKKYFENGLKQLPIEDRAKAMELREQLLNTDRGLVLMVIDPRTVCAIPAKCEANVPNYSDGYQNLTMRKIPSNYGCYQNLTVRNIPNNPSYNVIGEFYPALLKIAQNARKQEAKSNDNDTDKPMSPEEFCYRFMQDVAFDAKGLV